MRDTEAVSEVAFDNPYVGTMFLCVVFSSWVEAVEMPCLRFGWKKTGLHLGVVVPGKLDIVL